MYWIRHPHQFLFEDQDLAQQLAPTPEEEARHDAELMRQMERMCDYYRD